MDQHGRSDGFPPVNDNGAPKADASGERDELTWKQVTRTFAKPRDPQPVIALFAVRTEAERRALVPESTAARERLGAGDMRYVGIACLAGPAAITSRIPDPGLTWDSDLPEESAVEPIADRDPAWVPDVARRLAPRLEHRGSHRLGRPTMALARKGGIPTTPGHVSKWVGEATRFLGRSKTSLDHVLSSDPTFPTLFTPLFEAEGVGALFENHENYEGRLGWPVALDAPSRAGSSTGTSCSTDACLPPTARRTARLATRFIRIHKTMPPTDDEPAARTPSYLRMPPDAPAAVAELARKVLRRLDAAGRLDPERVAEAGRALLFRTEPKLVRTQLVWLRQPLTRHPEHRISLLLSLGTVFGAERLDTQVRAVALLAKRHQDLTSDQAERVRTGLREQLPLLAMEHRESAANLLGERVRNDDEPTHVALMPPPPREFPPPIASLDELVQEILVLPAAAGSFRAAVQAHAADPITPDRVVAALVREHAHDPTALRCAVPPLTERFERFTHETTGPSGTATPSAQYWPARPETAGSDRCHRPLGSPRTVQPRPTIRFRVGRPKQFGSSPRRSGYC